MTPLALFVRTLLRTSAIFIGTAIVFLHPPLDWRAGRTVTAVQSGKEMALDALMAVMNDSDVGVRRQVAASLGASANPRALPALRMMLHDAEPAVRRAALSSITKIERRMSRLAAHVAVAPPLLPAEASAKASRAAAGH
jgi:HEAT repeat protein